MLNILLHVKSMNITNNLVVLIRNLVFSNLVSKLKIILYLKNFINFIFKIELKYYYPFIRKLVFFFLTNDLLILIFN